MGSGTVGLSVDEKADAWVETMVAVLALSLVAWTVHVMVEM